MTEPVNVPTRAGLDELAAVTKAYARFSGPVTGFAGAITGAWLVVADRAWRVAPGAGAVLLSLTPLLWMALDAAARKHYRRHGRVTAPVEEAPMTGRYKVLAVMGISLMALVGISGQLGQGRWATVAIVALMAMPVVAILRVRADHDVMLVLVLAMLVVLPGSSLGWWGWSVRGSRWGSDCSPSARWITSATAASSAGSRR